MTRVSELIVEADLDNLKKVRSFISEAGNSLGANQDSVGDMCLVVDEAVTNVILHGYDCNEGTVKIGVKSEGDALVITIRDQAKTFNPDEVEAPHLKESLLKRDFGGMGVFLINKLTDEAEFRQLPGGGNELRLVKKGVISALQEPS